MRRGGTESRIVPGPAIPANQRADVFHAARAGPSGDGFLDHVIRRTSPGSSGMRSSRSCGEICAPGRYGVRMRVGICARGCVYVWAWVYVLVGVRVGVRVRVGVLACVGVRVCVRVWPWVCVRVGVRV